MKKPGESRAFSLPAIRRAPGACSAASCELAFSPRPPRWPAVGAAALPCFLHAAELRSAGLRSRANLPHRPASNAATGGLLDLVPPRGWFSALFSGAVHGLFHGPSLARGSLSLACPRESNQRRRKPRSRRRVLRASCAPGPRAGPGLRGGPSLAHLSGRRDPSRRSPGCARGRVRARSPRLMGAPFKRRPSLAAEAHRRTAASSQATGFRLAGRAGCPRSSGAPYGAAGGGRKRRRTSSGDSRDGSRRPERWHKDVPPRRPGRRPRTRRAGCP